MFWYSGWLSYSHTTQDLHENLPYEVDAALLLSNKISIYLSHDSPSGYYNHKGYHSIVLQALVDHQYRFTNVYVGWPGSVHDARIFSNSEVFAKGTSKMLLPNSVRTLAGVPVPVVIIGDPAYPLLPWLIKPYPGTGLSAKIKKIQ